MSQAPPQRASRPRYRPRQRVAGELRARIQAAAHQAGQEARAIERELAAALGVEAVSQLPEAAWGEVVAWFGQRLGW